MKQDWEVKPLSQVCKKLFAGGDVPKDRNSKFITEEFNVPIYSNGATNDGLYGYTDIPRVTEKSITVSARGTIGYSVIRTENYLPVVRLIVLIPNEELIILPFLKYVIETMDFGNSGSSIPQLTVPMIKKYESPIPSLEEQKQIVVVLDQAFAAIDQAKANIEKNLQNAKELFQSKLNEIFTQKGEGWEEKTLGEIASVEYGYTDKSTSEGDYRYIRITDIDNNGKLTTTAKKYIRASKEAEKFTVNDNDLLMARTGATFAKVLLYKDYEPSIFASYLIRINFSQSIQNELYWFFSKTDCYWGQANSLSSGAAQPHFNGKALKQVRFPYPKSVDAQKELIRKFRVFSDSTKRLEDIYQKKIDAMDEFKKSILQKAFAGGL